MTTTDATLRVPGHPRIFAIGDTAAALATSSDGADGKQGAFAPTAQVRLLSTRHHALICSCGRTRSARCRPSAALRKPWTRTAAAAPPSAPSITPATGSGC